MKVLLKSVLFVYLLIIFILSGCSSPFTLASPTLTAIPPTITSIPTTKPASTEETLESTQESISTPNIKLEGKDVLCPTSDEEARNSFNEAFNMELDGNIEEAKKLYAEAIRIDPNYCDAMDNLGRLFRLQNKNDDAIHWYQMSLEIKPDNTVALQNLGLTYKLQGQTDKSIETYEELIEIDSNNPEGYFGLGTVYYGLEQPDKAIPFFRTAENLYIEQSSPYVADAQYYLGFSYFVLRDCTNAKKYFELIYSHFSNDGGINYVLGICYLQSEPKDVSKAQDFITKAQQAGIQIPSEVIDALTE